MRGFNSSYKLICYALLLAFGLFSQKIRAQAFSVGINPSSQCYSNSSGNSASVYVAVTPSSPVTNYTWTISGGTCAPTYSNSAINGSVITVSFPCCGTFTFYCAAMNGSTLVATSSVSTTILCSPSVSVSGSSTLCAGSTISLNASGAQTYTWSFGATTSSVAVSPTASTVYSVVGSNSNGCVNTATHMVSVSSPVQANFTYTQSGLNAITYSSTSTGTMSGSTYAWHYGDGNTGNGITSQHSYSASGQYVVTLTVSNGASCSSSVTKTVVLNGCNLVSNFTHLALNNGVVNFNSSGSVTNSNTKYYWNFGDGIYSLASSPSHTYMNAGTYLVTLKLQDTVYSACLDTLTQSINVTGVSCNANANFTVIPTFSVAQNYIAIPAYPYNVSSARWYWGDGTQDSILYASHLYSVAANYSICLSVTVSCGATSIYCLNQYLSKSGESSSQIISINVYQPEMSTGISANVIDERNYRVFPNPSSSGMFYLQSNEENINDLTITVYSLFGERIYQSRAKQDGRDITHSINLTEAAEGIYFIKIDSGGKRFTKKIIISK